MFEDIQQWLANLTPADSIFGLLVSTFLLIFSVIVIRALIARYLRKHVVSIELRRKWLVQSRNGLIFVLVIGMISIWGEELRTLALSIVAIAVAFVVATKELILCFTGSILKTGARSFNLGDRIQIKDFRGDVIDQNLLATTILEVGPGKITHQRTGRMVVLPNALFVSEPVINEGYTHDYILHAFIVPFNRQDDWQTARKALLESAKKHCQPYIEKARVHMRRLSENKGLDVATVDPRVTIQVPSAGEIHLVVRIPTKSSDRSFIEQSILSEVLGDYNFSPTAKGSGTNT